MGTLTDAAIATMMDDTHPKPQVFEVLTETRHEDSGHSVQIELTDGAAIEQGMYVRVLSWDVTRVHEDMRKFLGKRVRVTVEVLEPAVKVCAGNASLKGPGEEPFHLADGAATLCGIPWQDRGWFQIDNDDEQTEEEAAEAPFCCRRCARKVSHD